MTGDEAYAGSHTGEMEERPRIVLFSGGTASRGITVALCQRPFAVARIVPAWDSGGSSRTIREAFDILAVGDIRQALMTLAHGEGRAGDVVRIFNARISSVASPAEARAEFDYYADARHPLLKRLEPGLKGVILSYLKLFLARAGQGFDFRRGSIGNFILAGAYFSHGNDINNAIFVFRQLCTIRGHVWPSTREDGVQLDAVLADGTSIVGQHAVTSLDERHAEIEIVEIALRAPGGTVAANPAAIDAVRGADLMVFGPGSLFTSVLPHLLVDGMAEAIVANRRAPKVFIGNMLESSETFGMDVATMVRRFLATCEARTEHGAPCLTHVLGNAELFPFERSVGQARYTRNGDLAELCATRNLTLVAGHFEDPWQRGLHDGPAVAAALDHILAGNAGDRSP